MVLPLPSSSHFSLTKTMFSETWSSKTLYDSAILVPRSLSTEKAESMMMEMEKMKKFLAADSTSFESSFFKNLWWGLFHPRRKLLPLYLPRSISDFEVNKIQSSFQKKKDLCWGKQPSAGKYRGKIAGKGNYLIGKKRQEKYFQKLVLLFKPLIICKKCTTIRIVISWRCQRFTL